MRTLRNAAVVVLGISLLAGCGSAGTGSSTRATSTASASDTGFPVTIHSGNTATVISSRPSRIMSLDPTATEDLFAIGAGPQVKVVDSDSDYPPSAPRDAKLSSYQPNIEAISTHNPDLVVLSNDIDHIAEQLAKLKVPTLLLPAATGLTQTYTELRQLGLATGHTAAADALVARMKQRIATEVSRVPKPAKPLTYFYELDTTLYTATSGTFIGGICSLFGLRDIADAASKPTDGGYPQLSDEYVVSSAPDLILLSDGQTPAQVARRPAWSGIPAVRHGDVVSLNMDIASRWGPRVVDLVDAIGSAVTAAERHRS